MTKGIRHPDNYVWKQLQKDIKNNKTKSEIVWSFIVSKKYQNHQNLLVNALCGCDEEIPNDHDILVEPYLYPTRQRDHENMGWKTRADLVVGWYSLVKNRKFQIRSSGDWICIGESKIFDDIRPAKGCPEVSQLAKIIDHALLLHDRYGKFPSRVYLTAITPRYFKEKQGDFSDSLLWHEYHKYKKNPDTIATDLRLCNLPFLKHNVDILINRIKSLKLRWVTFEELLDINNIVEDYSPGKYRITFESWKQIFECAKLQSVYSEIISINPK